ARAEGRWAKRPICCVPSTSQACPSHRPSGRGRNLPGVLNAFSLGFLAQRYDSTEGTSARHSTNETLGDAMCGLRHRRRILGDLRLFCVERGKRHPGKLHADIEMRQGRIGTLERFHETLRSSSNICHLAELPDRTAERSFKFPFQHLVVGVV